MTGFTGNIEELTRTNNVFRKVLFTGQHVQLVLMCLNPHEDIGVEIHPTTDQFLRVESGEGKIVMNSEEHLVKDGSSIVVPAGTEHNLINTSPVNPLKLYTIYSPPHHKDGIIHKTKQEAVKDESDHL